MTADASEGSRDDAKTGKHNEILLRFRSFVVEFAFKASDVAIHPRFLLFVTMAMAFGLIFCFAIDLIVNVINYQPLVKTWHGYWLVGPAIGFLLSWLLFIRPPITYTPDQNIDAPNLALVKKYLESIPERDRTALLAVALAEDLNTRKDATKAEKAKGKRTRPNDDA